MDSFTKVTFACLYGLGLVACVLTNPFFVGADTDTTIDAPDIVEAEEHYFSAIRGGWNMLQAQNNCELIILLWQDSVCGESEIIYAEITHECRLAPFVGRPQGPVFQALNGMAGGGPVLLGNWTCECESLFYCTVGVLE